MVVAIKKQKKIKSLESIKYVYRDVLDVLSFYEFEDEIFLGLIRIKEEYRYKGYGKEIMNEICEYADETKKIITLTPLYREKEEEGQLFSLVEYYSKNFGFVLNQDENEMLNIKEQMYRKPTKQKEKKQ